MKKSGLLFRVSVMAVAVVLLLSCTGANGKVLNANSGAPETAHDECSSTSAKNEALTYSEDRLIYLESDAPDEYVFQRAARKTVRLNYTIYSFVDADDYRIVCSGENITLLSPVEYSVAGQTDSYALEFLAPECGEGYFWKSIACIISILIL